MLRSPSRKTLGGVLAVSAVALTVGVLAGGTPAGAAAACSRSGLSNGTGLSPGGCITDYTNPGAYNFVFDNGGHGILIRTSDGKHCASWPAPGSVHPKAHLTFHSSSSGVYFDERVGSGTPYVVVTGSPNGDYSTLSVDHGHLWVGSRSVHGC
jgi:hypothetical protein